MMPRHVDVAAILVIILCAAAIAWTNYIPDRRQMMRDNLLRGRVNCRQWGMT
jgi:hypothetical protein